MLEALTVPEVDEVTGSRKSLLDAEQCATAQKRFLHHGENAPTTFCKIARYFFLRGFFEQGCNILCTLIYSQSMEMSMAPIAAVLTSIIEKSARGFRHTPLIKQILAVEVREQVTG
jgi:hypothetical protein